MASPQKSLSFQLYSKEKYTTDLPKWGEKYWLYFGKTWQVDGTKEQLIEATNDLAKLLQANAPYDKEYPWAFKQKAPDNRASIYLYALPELQGAADLRQFEADLLAVVTTATQANKGTVLPADRQPEGLYYQIVSQF